MPQRRRLAGLGAMRCALVVLGLLALPVAAPNAAETAAAPTPDRHAGYYYPPVATTEIYQARAVPMIEASRRTRVQFTVNITQQMLARPQAPEFIMFAKGDKAEKLIIVGLHDGAMNTIYRARAVLAMLTSIARSSPLFREFGVEDYFTFFDLAALFGFERITITDGKTFSHRIELD